MRALAALLVLCGVFAVSAAGAPHRSRPALIVTDTWPFTVRGTHFRARERVTVTLRLRGRHVRRTTAGAGGSFTVRFRGIRLGDCIGYVVSARGNRGSRATLKLAVECANGPAGAPDATPPPSPTLDDLHPIDPNPRKR